MCECCCNRTGPGHLLCTDAPGHTGQHHVTFWDIDNPTDEIRVEWADNWWEVNPVG